jgi:serine/threonine protein kinase
MNKSFLLKDRQNIYKKYNKMVITSFKKKSVLGEGEQGKVYKYCEQDNFCIAVKKVYVEEESSKHINKIHSKQALKDTLFVELFVNKLVNKVLLEGASPNFVFFYNNHFEERSGVCYEDYPYSSYFYNEYINDSESFASWVYKKRSLKMLYNAFFQIVTAIYTVQKQFGLQHLDMHAENILVKKIPKGGYFKYIINGVEYNIPNLGYLFVINDYGYAWIPKNKKKDREYDVNFILNDVKPDLPVKIINDIKYIVKNLKSNKIEFEDIINEIWGDLYKKAPKGSKLLEVYRPDKNIKLETKIKEIIKVGINN